MKDINIFQHFGFKSCKLCALVSYWTGVIFFVSIILCLAFAGLFRFFDNMDMVYIPQANSGGFTFLGTILGFPMALAPVVLSSWFLPPAGIIFGLAGLKTTAKKKALWGTILCAISSLAIMAVRAVAW